MKGSLRSKLGLFHAFLAILSLLRPFQTFFVIVGIFSKLGVKTKLAHHDDDDSEFCSISYVHLLMNEKDFSFFSIFSNIARIPLMMMTAMVVRNSNRSTLPQPSWPISVRGEGNGGWAGLR